jgi:ribosomal protein L37AE/L43A
MHIEYCNQVLGRDKNLKNGVMLMKNTKLCPKCNSTNLLGIQGKHTEYVAGNIIIVGWTALNVVKITRFVCEQCGRFRTYGVQMAGS